MPTCTTLNCKICVAIPTPPTLKIAFSLKLLEVLMQREIKLFKPEFIL